MNDLGQALAEDARIDYAVLFGSGARGTAHASSDLDIAIGLGSNARMSALELGDLIARLEHVSRRSVDIVVVNEAPAALAYRVFRDGRVILERNHATLAAHKARAILEYLDFLPIEALAARGVLTAAADGR
jgi:predicted nucleotidyltransferase